MWLLASWLWPLAGASLAVLRYTARSGAEVTLPVQVARDGDRAVIFVGRAESKRWWRHFTTPAPVEMLVGGAWRAGVGALSSRGDAAGAYRRAHPRIAVADDATLVAITPDRSMAALLPLRGRALARAWFATVTVAEFVGFAAPAVVGALTANANVAYALPALLVAGWIEGGLLGAGQAAVLRHALPGLPRRRWIVATAGAAVLAYAIGLTPSAARIETWPTAFAVAFAIVGGSALLTSIGAAQWLVLRRHVDRAGRWIWSTAVAWIVGLGAFLGFATPLWRPGQALWLTVAIGVAGGLLMAAITSAITGAALRRLAR